MKERSKALRALGDFIKSNSIVPLTSFGDDTVHEFFSELFSLISDMKEAKIEDLLYEVFQEHIDSRIADKTILMDAVQDNILSLLDIQSKGRRFVVDPNGNTQDYMLEVNSKVLLDKRRPSMSLKSAAKKTATRKKAATKKATTRTPKGPIDRPAAKSGRTRKAFTPSTGKESYLNPDKKKPEAKSTKKKAAAKKSAPTKKSATTARSRSGSKLDSTITSGAKQATRGIMETIQKHVGKKKLKVAKVIESVKLDHPKAKDPEFVKYYVLAALRNGFLKETK